MDEQFREHLYTIDEAGRRKWVYASCIKGRFYYLRAAVAYVLMAVYLGLPWIKINGRPGALF
ncbi:MAG TPA: cytochrome c oxidase accessory protein CcoG, partial [Oligoflexia bacterium]|nr:cytochrome c oxidase accessory protein CcoG [Oligoflexia bacterium]